MPYQYDLGLGQKIYLDNSGSTTVITLASSGLGQQQQSGTQVQTGLWTEVPQAARIDGGVMLRCVTAQGVFVWQVQGTQIGMADTAAWPAHQAVALQPMEAGPAAMPPMAPMQPIPPLEPMAPMTMGNMRMSANPMTMQMGNMTLSMGSAPKAKQFCTQCGSAVQAGDRFCGSCGHQLQ
ncbi:zinc ribbon domain-containing protein [filamentous cyanobacterium CCT1]|nr:zinc ribbon domain-containing protein [filamentous cyanobacterium CCT1]PSN79703.1 zinc ribbon domain-containing protein [filamentous cyanobacterium CCP4]